MGFALANAFSEAGADVTVISGPVQNIPFSEELKIIGVLSAEEMYREARSRIEMTDVAVFAAAVADFTPEIKADKKIKREGDELVIRLKPTVDIAGELGKSKLEKQLFIGFALETNDGLENAGGKLKRKNLDLIVLNSLEDKGAGFGTDTNKITMIDKFGNIDKFELKQKHDVARDIVAKTIKLLKDA